MKREHTPRPGVTWETRPVRTETVVDDDAPDPRPGRAERRALARASRRKPMTDQPRDQVNRYARLDPIARALVDDHDAIALAEMLVKAHDDLEHAWQELQHHAEQESADAAAGSYASSSGHAIADPARWLHILFTSPDETTANTSALNLADHLAAEFPGISMRITSNADEEAFARIEADLVESGVDTPGCDCGHDGMGISWHGDDCPWRRDVLDGTAPTPARPGLREQLHTAIESEVYEYRERTMWWPETGGITEEIARLATRGALEAIGQPPTPPAWTPPPSGSTREQLPETLLTLIRDRLPDYTSTACQTADTVACAACYPGSGVPRPQYDEIREHAERLHERCRINHKFTGQPCACGCHPEEQP